MKKHFNIYYLFFEDKAQTKMTREKHREIWKKLESFFLTLPKDCREERKKEEELD